MWLKINNSLAFEDLFHFLSLVVCRDKEMFITLKIVSTEYYRLKNYINKLVNNRVRAVVKKFA